jgi:hypothetical protein
MHFDSARTLSWEIMGSYYGYPACCIDAFTTTLCMDVRKQYPTNPWSGTGFLPCIECAPKALNFARFVEDNIKPNRISAAAFPDMEDKSDADPHKEWYYDFHERGKAQSWSIDTIRKMYLKFRPELDYLSK